MFNTQILDWNVANINDLFIIEQFMVQKCNSDEQRRNSLALRRNSNPEIGSKPEMEIPEENEDDDDEDDEEYESS